MFEYIVVNNGTILKDCKLCNLGKINVICGKNNSGKTTLLTAINNQTDRTIYLSLTDERLTRIHKHSAAEDWKRFQDFSDSYLKILQSVANLQPVWGRQDRAKFVDIVLRKIREDGNLRNYGSFDQSRLVNSYDRLLADNYKTVLLPPKRLLELSKQVDSSEQVQPSGSGILNWLFYAKNQQESSDDTARYAQLKLAFSEISSGYDFTILLREKNEIGLVFARKGEPWVQADYCGLGLRDLIVMLYFALHPEYGVVSIEEPESHLHPDMQRKLLSVLRKETDKQYFLTTHSNVFLDNALVSRVLFTKFDGQVIVGDVTSRASVLDDLGYSVADNLVSDLVILVEGPYDVPVVEEFLIKLGLYASYDIKMWPLGGDIMDQVDLSVFAQNYAIIALVDKDPKSARIRKRFENKCAEAGIPVHRLKRYAIENYFTMRVLREVFGPQIPDGVNDIDPKLKLEDQIGLNVKNNNRSLARKMQLEEIEGTDLMRFFEKVGQMCASIKAL